MVGSVFGVDTRQRKKFDLFSNGHSSGETKDGRKTKLNWTHTHTLYRDDEFI